MADTGNSSREAVGALVMRELATVTMNASSPGGSVIPEDVPGPGALATTSFPGKGAASGSSFIHGENLLLPIEEIIRRKAIFAMPPISGLTPGTNAKPVLSTLLR